MIQSAFHFYQTEKHDNQTFLHEDLHVFVIHENDVAESLNQLNNLYSLRTRKSKEFWLVDVTYRTNKFHKGRFINQISLDFKDLPLDFDDDLYLFSSTHL